MTMDKMPSVRGLTEGMGGGPGTPLRKFYGTLAAIHRERNEKFNTTIVHMDFTDVQVLAATEVYPFPIATVQVKESNRKNSSWGVFAASLVDCISESEDLINQTGRKLGLEWTPGHDLGFPDKNAEAIDEKGTKPNVIIEAWEVFEVAGKTRAGKAKTSMEILADILDGKTQADFNKEALAHAAVRNSPDAQKAIMSNAFINGAVQIGQFTKDANGVYHRTK